MNTSAQQSRAGGWAAALGRRARHHPLSVLGLLSGMAALAAVAHGLSQPANAQTAQNVRWAFLGGSAGFAATALGALPILFLRRLPQKAEDVMLGGAAGMMLAAAFFSLLVPALEAAERFTGSGWTGALLVVAGIAAGVALMLGLDAFTPHEHERSGPWGPGHERFNRIWLFVFAVAIHNLPEGMAIGVGYAQGDLKVALPLTAAIALQDVPEGLAVAMTLKAIGTPVWRAIAVAAAGGLLEPLGALVGVLLVGNSVVAYPMGLGLAAGAMLFVVSHEVIPETHRNGHQTLATVGLMIGFVVMMVLDTAL
ncbi:ZIP family metal transporter [Ramlibacter sp.]|uniref:ZIP family metal transporter n=1 Tax=Ramlibacter sp. TaxID=1917967 RepID=UPI0039C9D4F1